MVAAAAVLGTLAGTCVGYLVQADRDPTPLPPLSQPVVGQAEGKVAPLSAAQDRQVATDGDLRKLLVDRPKGTRAVPSLREGWLDLADYADTYNKPSVAFVDANGDGFRRAVATSWRVGETYSVVIHLVQFRQKTTMGASEWADNGKYWAEERDHTRSWPLPGTGEDNGMVYVHDEPERKAGYLPLYTAEAHAWRGDVYMEIYVNDTEPIPKAKIMDLAERQVGKL
ncbi:hypothetical protein [Streptomyces galbus]|uniref:Uncharacterized protein n=1 Tax=Streptomyces galbus TaxID=33898 RepID=A0ABX1IMN2_STRGB|nr:hypothetical protein [Streptomyces galbus]NKQ26652.1 hypothetical protein [Streptomyces galbus]